MANDALNGQQGGDHYVKMAIQPAEYVYKNKIGYLEGQSIKYLSRHQAKGGAMDLRKAIHFVQMVLEWEYGIKSDVTYTPPAVGESVPANSTHVDPNTVPRQSVLQRTSPLDLGIGLTPKEAAKRDASRAFLMEHFNAKSAVLASEPPTDFVHMEQACSPGEVYTCPTSLAPELAGDSFAGAESPQQTTPLQPDGGGKKEEKESEKRLPPSSSVKPAFSTRYSNGLNLKHQPFQVDFFQIKTPDSMWVIERVVAVIAQGDEKKAYEITLEHMPVSVTGSDTDKPTRNDYLYSVQFRRINCDHRHFDPRSHLTYHMAGGGPFLRVGISVSSGDPSSIELLHNAASVGIELAIVDIHMKSTVDRLAKAFLTTNKNYFPMD